MADTDINKAETSAEKAYAEAIESAAKPKAAAVPAEAKAPAKTKAPAKAKSPASTAPASTAPATKAKAKPAAKAAPAPKATPAPKAKPAAKAKPVSAKKPAAKPATAKKTPAPKAPAAKAKAKPVAKPVKTKPVSNTKPTPKTDTKSKEIKMAAKINEDIKKFAGEAQAKAKETFEKSSALMGEVGEFTKGNFEAVAESGKILAEGLKSMSTTVAADSRTALDTVSSDMKEFASIKSPADLFELQSEMVRKNIESAIELSTKNSEAMVKLIGDAAAPISGRVNLAVEKVRSIAA